MKKAVRSSKKDGKGGPFGDFMSGAAQKMGDTVKKVGDTKIKDAVAGVGRAMTFPGRAVAHSIHDAGGAVKHAVGTEWAKTRGEGQKKGLLKQAVQKAKPAVMPNLTPKSPSIIHKPGQPSPFGGRLPMKPKQPLQPIKPMLPKNPVRPLRPHRPHRPITPRKRFA